MKLIIAFGAMALSSLALSCSVQAAAVDLTFENIAPYPNDSNVLIQNYYNGGTSSIGTSGPDVGISFSDNALLICLNTADVVCSNASRGGAGDPNSQDGALFFLAGNSATLNDPAGFTQGVTFEYASLYQTGTAQVWSGLNGTGTLLASAYLAPDAAPCLEYNANYCPFSLAGLNFSGTAKSLNFVSAQNQFVFDDITLSSLFTGKLPVAALPEPATWALMLSGFGLIGALRRRRAHRAPSTPWQARLPVLAVPYATGRTRRS